MVALDLGSSYSAQTAAVNTDAARSSLLGM